MLYQLSYAPIGLTAAATRPTSWRKVRLLRFVVVPILVILSHVILSLSKHVILSSSKHVILSHVILSLSKDEAERMTRAITQHISGSAWGCSSAGRASALHVEGLGFESPHLQKEKPL